MQHLGQDAWLGGLQEVDQDDESEEQAREAGDDVQEHGVDQRQTEDDEGDDEEGHDEIEDGEPLVLQDFAAEDLGDKEWPAHEGNDEEEGNSADVEDAVAEGQL